MELLIVAAVSWFLGYLHGKMNEVKRHSINEMPMLPSPRGDNVIDITAQLRRRSVHTRRTR